MRVMRGTRPVMIKRVKYIPPVLELHLEPMGNWFKFKEGQYLYLNIPHIDPNLGELFSSWHPFTISSAMGDLKEKTEKDRFVSLHIKVWPGGWTEKLKNYLELMNPNDSYPMTFTRRDEYVRVVFENITFYYLHRTRNSHFEHNRYGAQKLGKILGPDNKPLIRIDGPHASPSQHYDEYKTLMLVGVGVGMTPCASILRGILLYVRGVTLSVSLSLHLWTQTQSQTKQIQDETRRRTQQCVLLLGSSTQRSQGISMVCLDAHGTSSRHRIESFHRKDRQHEFCGSSYLCHECGLERTARTHACR